MNESTEKRLSVLENFDLTEVPNFDISGPEGRSQAVVIETSQGIFLFEPQLGTMFEITTDMCRETQRRLIPLELRNSQDLGTVFTVRQRGRADLSKASKVEKAKLLATAILHMRGVYGEIVKKIDGPKTHVLELGRILEMETGLNGKPWVVTREGHLRLGPIEKIYVVNNFKPDPDMAEKAQLSSTPKENFTRELADMARRGNH